MADPETPTALPELKGRPAIRGIHAIRVALGLGTTETALIRRHGDRLSALVEPWVEQFYVRLLLNPVAQALLVDDARVVRLKRSLSAWFHEIFSLPFDEDYERTRTSIGHTHRRIGMPAHLMVTAMGWLRRSVAAAIREAPSIPDEDVEPLARALDLVFDMELALMIEAYRRQERRVLREKDRAIYGERAIRLLALTQRDRLDAALCYAEMALDVESGPARKLLVELRDLLRELGRAGRPLSRVGTLDAVPVREAAMIDVCRLALDDVSLDNRTGVVIDVTPIDLTMRVRAEAVRLAVEEMLQNAASHGAGGEIHLEVSRDAQSGCIRIEVRDTGPGWAANIEHLRDIYAEKTGLGLSFCELVAELHDGSLEIFHVAGGGAGVRLVLHELQE